MNNLIKTHLRYRFGFDIFALILFLLIMAPNIIWSFIEAPNDVLRVESVTKVAIRIASISYVFMAFTIGIQGILQGLRNAVSPLILSLLRLCVFIFPIAYAFTYLKNVVTFVWITFIISEFLTSIISFIVIKKNVNVNIKNK